MTDDLQEGEYSMDNQQLYPSDDAYERLEADDDNENN